MGTLRRAAPCLLLAGLALPGPAAPAQEPPPPPPRRVVVLAIDGADAAVFEDLRARGRLPHFDALAKAGAYRRLLSTNPAQSPVAWAAFATGSNPGKSGIFDFLRRDPAVPGKIVIGLAEAGTREGPVSPGLRLLLPFATGAALGLLVFAAVRLLLRPFRAVSDRARRLSGTIAGLAAAFGMGVASHVVIGWIPARLPVAVSSRLGAPLWVVLGEAGVRSVAVEAPVSFPADRARNLDLLAGLGTPDVQGTWGYYAVFTGDEKEVAVPETGGRVDALRFDASGTARSRVYGPPDLSLGEEEKAAIGRQVLLARGIWEAKVGVPSGKRFEERVYRHAEAALQSSCILEVRKGPAPGTATVRVGTGGPKPVLDLPLPTDPKGPAAALPAPDDGSVAWGEPVTLKRGEWSDYVPFEFAMNPILEVKGIGKFWLEDAGDGGKPFRLVLTPVSFDPRDVPPVVEASWPAGFAPSLAAKAGLYGLVGWPCLTNPVKDGMLSDEAFLRQVRGVLEERRRKLRACLAREDWRFLFVMFSEVDRVQHAFWRHVDPKSPRHDPEAAKTYGPAIEESYVAMDGVLGEIRAAAGGDTAVLVLSDHGFAPFRRSVNLNNWLLDNGFQRGKLGSDRDVGEIFTGRNFLAGLDWAETKAYALGLGGIYLNLAGREKLGTVAARDADAVCAAIREKLLRLRDGDGSRVVREVYLGKDLYHGPAAARYAPDLVVGFERGYRVSWQTTLGGGGAAVIEDNEFPWSGDHCSVDPSLVPGILVSSAPLAEGEPSVIDVAPTVLDLLGVPAPADWDGKSRLRR